MAKTKKIHVNQHVIKANREQGRRDPVMTCKTYNSNQYGSEVVIKGDDGKEVARVVYSPDKPLSCGAVCWVQTKNEVEVL